MASIFDFATKLAAGAAQGAIGNPTWAQDQKRLQLYKDNDMMRNAMDQKELDLRKDQFKWNQNVTDQRMQVEQAKAQKAALQADLNNRLSYFRALTDIDPEYESAKQSIIDHPLMRELKARTDGIGNLEETGNTVRNELKAKGWSGQAARSETEQGMTSIKNAQYPNSIPKVSTEDEYNRLPKGSLFIAPDGSTRRK
ncbi:MAG: hypothetical protein D4R45_01295 [Planctomycetaceae bacterium]|nr:MAG: hypothetical protein D4R45_01295 [Planctomycetaceae bacterium]